MKSKIVLFGEIEKKKKIFTCMAEIMEEVNGNEWSK